MSVSSRRIDAPLNDSSHDAPFEIRIDGGRKLLTMVLKGIWDEAIFEQFATAYIDAIERLATFGGVSHQLVDAAEFPLQPADIADRFPALIEAAHYPSAQRTACVVPSLLSRAQAREGGEIVNARYFRTLADAQEWLFSDEA